jgi:hypothetical protein
MWMGLIILFTESCFVFVRPAHGAHTQATPRPVPPMAADVPPDQTATQWRDDAWLATYPLNTATALDYFAGSPFYDRACLNERARAQGVGVDQVR